MMSFCKRSVHSFLGTNDNNGIILKPSPPPPRCRNIPSPISGLSLIAITGDTKIKPPYLLESSTVPNYTCSSSPTGTGVGTAKKDSGGIGFIDDIGGGVDGLMSCTESLGFESSDERRTDGDEQLMSLLDMNGEGEERENDPSSKTKRNNNFQWRKKRNESMNSFPPPLSSLKHNGQPSFYLRPVRKDGRLELTEVRIDRTEVLRASRRDGRLRLHLIRDDDDIDDVEEDEEIEEEKVEEEKESIGEWKLPAVTNAVGGDGFRRCYELVNHHSNLNAWNQHCVTTG